MEDDTDETIQRAAMIAEKHFLEAGRRIDFHYGANYAELNPGLVAGFMLASVRIAGDISGSV